MQQPAVPCARRGRPRVRPDRVAGDKGYSSRTVRQYLRRRGIGAVIPTRSTERHNPRFDRAAYRERNTVERLFNRLKQFRAIATRYDKLALRYHAGITLVCSLLWL
jgi:transposase